MGEPVFDRIDDLFARVDQLLEAQREITRAEIAAEAREHADRDRMILEAFQEGPSEADRIAQANQRSVSLEFIRDLRDTYAF